MSLIDNIRRSLILAPHPDDEVLGCGGTMARLVSLGREVHVGIVTRGREPRFNLASVELVDSEMRAAHAAIGVTHLHRLDFPAAELDHIPHSSLNAGIGDLIESVAPDTLFVPFLGDIHLDHQLVFASAMVACRPRAAPFPTRILAYETLSETNWNAPHLTPAFLPNVFIDITQHLHIKLQAFALFTSQVQPPPSERSLATIEALATLRGATVHRAAAEAFVLIREVG